MHQFWWQMICLSSRQCATFQLWLGGVKCGLTVLKSGPAFRSFFWFICHCNSIGTLLKGALTRLDVVSREEFDAQTAVLRRTRERLEQVEQDIASLSQSLDSPDGPDGS